MLEKEKHNLVLLHFAGGSSYSYNFIKEQFSNNKHFSTLELPGRGKRFDHRKVNTYQEAVEDYLDQIKKSIFDSGPYIIYGHSMGALLGYLICQKLQEEKLPMPEKLVVSGKKSPNIPRENKIAHLPDEEFWNQIIALGGIPDEMKNSPELIEYYLPILRHDLKLTESYQYQKKPKLNIPIDVFYGSEEAHEDDLAGWRDETTHEVTITQLEGNHFFIFKHVDFFTNYFRNIHKTLNHNYV